MIRDESPFLSILSLSFCPLTLLSHAHIDDPTYHSPLSTFSPSIHPITYLTLHSTESSRSSTASIPQTPLLHYTFDSFYFLPFVPVSSRWRLGWVSPFPCILVLFRSSRWHSSFSRGSEIGALYVRFYSFSFIFACIFRESCTV